jgi:hypothetical protein
MSGSDLEISVPGRDQATLGVGASVFWLITPVHLRADRGMPLRADECLDCAREVPSPRSAAGRGRGRTGPARWPKGAGGPRPAAREGEQCRAGRSDRLRIVGGGSAGVGYAHAPGVRRTPAPRSLRSTDGRRNRIATVANGWWATSIAASVPDDPPARLIALEHPEGRMARTSRRVWVPELVRCGERGLRRLSLPG